MLYFFNFIIWFREDNYYSQEFQDTEIWLHDFLCDITIVKCLLLNYIIWLKCINSNFSFNQTFCDIKNAINVVLLKLHNLVQGGQLLETGHLRCSQTVGHPQQGTWGGWRPSENGSGWRTQRSLSGFCCGHPYNLRFFRFHTINVFSK